MPGRGLHFAAVVVVDENPRRRRALRDVVDGLDGIDVVTEASTGLEAAKKAQHADVVLMNSAPSPTPPSRRPSRWCAARPAAWPSSRLRRQRSPRAGGPGRRRDVVPAACGPGAHRARRGHRGAARARTLDPDLIRPVLRDYAELLEDARRRDRAAIESLATAVEAKDTVTSHHLHAVSQLAVRLPERVAPELARSDDFLFGCLLHDVGKIGVPERILTKPAPLTREEWAVMRTHPSVGAEVIRPLRLAHVSRTSSSTTTSAGTAPATRTDDLEPPLASIPPSP